MLAKFEGAHLEGSKRRGDLRLVRKEGSHVLPSFEDARLAGLGSETTEVVAR